MSGKHFKSISKCIRLIMGDLLEYSDRFFLVQDLLDGFNVHMTEVFVPYWIVRVDDSMVVFYNKYVPGWVTVKYKLYPL